MAMVQFDGYYCDFIVWRVSRRQWKVTIQCGSCRDRPTGGGNYGIYWPAEWPEPMFGSQQAAIHAARTLGRRHLTAGMWRVYTDRWTESNAKRLVYDDGGDNR